MALAAIVGYPRIGRERQLKWATERYWAGKLDADSLLETARSIRQENWQTQVDAGIDLVAVNDFSLYDQMLDTAALVGAAPDVYGWKRDQLDLATYFRMARGEGGATGIAALELTKWFDTNYHYLVPELSPGQTFQIASDKPFAEHAEATTAGHRSKVALIGPVTFLRLSKMTGGAGNPLDLLAHLLPVYCEIVEKLASSGARWIEFQEPALVAGGGAGLEETVARAYSQIAEARGKTRVLLHLPYGDPGALFGTLAALPVDGLGFDFTRSARLADRVVDVQWPDGKVLAAGVVDGRNIWINDLSQSLGTLQQLAGKIGGDSLMVTTSCSLQHVPHDIRLETNLDPELSTWLAFAEQKLAEAATLTTALNLGSDVVSDQFDANRQARATMAGSMRRTDPVLRARIDALRPSDRERSAAAADRYFAQSTTMPLPLLPTTTIGSFPQTSELRNARKQLDRGEVTNAEYDMIIADSIATTIASQEAIGLDVLVHGEPERNDMVQFFAEQLNGIAVTSEGWVQSYGTRCVRPPIIYADVSRPAPMTVRWATYAQSLTSKPVKGMLTGPVTMLNWSFVRDDQPRADTSEQIALAIRDEVADLIEAGLRIVQIDEPALREGLPLDRDEWDDYLSWATAAFRLSASSAPDSIQVHTHMCYSEFGDVISAIDALDADVLSIENARSSHEMLAVFRDYGYEKGVGPGVYDVHSPRIPPVDEIADAIRSTVSCLDRNRVWVNPDCGLKTRKPQEVVVSLDNMVTAAKLVRAELSPP